MFKFYLPFYDEQKINSYEEFNIFVQPRETLPTKAGVPLKHQELISNLMRGDSPIEKLLLVHDMGTGKTCTAIHAIEKNLKDTVYGMKKALILNRGKAIMNNFIHELVDKCTTEYSGISEKVQKNLWSKFYTFDTFEIFAKKVRDLSDEQIRTRYNNTFIVIDEVHNIINDDSETYQTISRFLATIPNKKLLLLSGTPIRDSPENIVPILNLLFDRPEDKINPKTFFDTYYDASGNINNAFKNKIMGKVSYLKASVPEISVEYVGTPKPFELQKFTVITHMMSKLQAESYIRAYNLDFKSGGVYSNSRQASRMVFPDGSYGTAGFNKYVAGKSISTYRFRPNMVSELTKYGTSTENVLKRISEFSAKYAYIIRSILNASEKGEKSIVYDDLVLGSGLVTFSLLLNFVGFKKYRLLTSETSLKDIDRIQQTFNEDLFGEKISVILGSRVIAEGFTFLDVLHEHLVPHWNNTETMQVVARGIRMGSHTRILRENPDAVVRVYRHISLSPNYKQSIDYIMTKTSEEKEIEVDKVLDTFQEVSITCNAFMERNGSNKCSDTFSVTSDTTRENIISVGNLSENLLNKIKNYFVKNTSVHITVLQEYLHNISLEELIKYLFFLIINKVPLKNRLGIVCYLNHRKNFFFTTENIRTESDVLMSVYSQSLRPYNTLTEEENYLEAINIEMEDINSPKNKQRLLEMALTVKLSGLGDQEAADKILQDYSGYWLLDSSRLLAAAWYRADIVEENASNRCLINPTQNKPWLEWNKCSRQINEEIRELKMQRNKNLENDLINRNVQYYGLFHPTLDEFCIRHLDKNTVDTEDRRKIASGKRCVNWNKRDLIDIARTQLNLDQELANWDEWIGSSREVLCRDIRASFKRKNLLFENRSCGVQTKRK